MVVIFHHTSSLLLERIKQIHSIQLSLYDNHYYYIFSKIDVINKPNDIVLVYYHTQQQNMDLVLYTTLIYVSSLIVHQMVHHYFLVSFF